MKCLRIYRFVRSTAPARGFVSGSFEDLNHPDGFLARAWTQKLWRFWSPSSRARKRRTTSFAWSSDQQGKSQRPTRYLSQCRNILRRGNFLQSISDTPLLLTGLIIPTVLTWPAQVLGRTQEILWSLCRPDEQGQHVMLTELDRCTEELPLLWPVQRV